VFEIQGMMKGGREANPTYVKVDVQKEEQNGVLT
jgi:hypothetical protein